MAVWSRKLLQTKAAAAQGQAVQKAQMNNSATEPTRSLDRGLAQNDRIAAVRGLQGLQGEVALATQSGAALVQHTRAGHQASDPCRDVSLVKTGKGYIFACVISAARHAKGASYLHRNLWPELEHQLANAPSVPHAFQATLQALDTAFRHIHASNGPVLGNLNIVAAYVDSASSAAYIASNGGTRCVAGIRRPDGCAAVAADVGSAAEADASSSSDDVSVFSAEHVEVIPLEPALKVLVLGSKGLWNELGASAAMLRMQQYHLRAPAANHGNAALHLTNFALHGVTRRLRRSNDPRMAALHEVCKLDALHVGDRSQFKYGKRQPVRRRRGDVHGDLSAVVLHFDWAGKDMDAEAAVKLRHSQSTPNVANAHVQSPSARAHWRLLRMHFLTFPRAYRTLRQQQWAALIAAAKAQQAGLPLPSPASVPAAPAAGSLQPAVPVPAF